MTVEAWRGLPSDRDNHSPTSDDVDQAYCHDCDEFCWRDEPNRCQCCRRITRAEVNRDDLRWLIDTASDGLWQVHSEFCASFGPLRDGEPVHCCDVDQERIDRIAEVLDR